jgi:glutathione synthase/RimK-type ligase-like ATP-grasp enzyme
MLNICVIHPKRCTESATKLAKALGCDVSNPYKERRVNYRDYDLVINYGIAEPIGYHRVLNMTLAVERCKNKLKTLQYLQYAGVPVPWFSFSQEVVEKRVAPVETLYVCHTEQYGMQNRGIEYRHADELVPAHLYTEYFHHKKEYRVVVLKGKVIGIYSKLEREKGEWDLVSLQNKGFKEINEQCIKAAAVLNIDYVGFDVVANTRKDFRIIEANSGPIITDQTIEAFKQLLKD